MIKKLVLHPDRLFSSDENIRKVARALNKSNINTLSDKNQLQRKNKEKGAQFAFKKYEVKIFKQSHSIR